MKKLPTDRERGMGLIELMVAMIVGSLVCLLAFSFYRNLMGRLEKQKQVTSLQDGIRSAVDCINRYLIAGGVAGDTLFFDPHRILGATFVNGGHRVFELTKDSLSLTVYGNFSGGAGTLAAPVIDKSIRTLKTDKPGLFHAGSYAYIYAGSAQEVAYVQSVKDSSITVSDDFFAPYPKGTLIFPLERVSISRTDKQTLRIARESANGTEAFVRTFTPTQHPGDSLAFKISGLDRLAGQVSYVLTFTARTTRPKNLLLARKSDQTVFVRGF